MSFHCLEHPLHPSSLFVIFPWVVAAVKSHRCELGPKCCSVVSHNPIPSTFRVGSLVHLPHRKLWVIFYRCSYSKRSIALPPQTTFIIQRGIPSQSCFFYNADSASQVICASVEYLYHHSISCAVQSLVLSCSSWSVSMTYKRWFLLAIVVVHIQTPHPRRPAKLRTYPNAEVGH